MQKRVAEAEDGYEAHWAKYTEAKAQQWQAEDALVNLHIKIGGNAMQIRRAPGFEELSVSTRPLQTDDSVAILHRAASIIPRTLAFAA